MPGEEGLRRRRCGTSGLAQHRPASVHEKQDEKQRNGEKEERERKAAIAKDRFGAIEEGGVLSGFGKSYR